MKSKLKQEVESLASDFGADMGAIWQARQKSGTAKHGRPPNIVEPAEALAALTKDMMSRAQRWLHGELRAQDIEQLLKDIDRGVISKAAKKFEAELRNAFKGE